MPNPKTQEERETTLAHDFLVIVFIAPLAAFILNLILGIFIVRFSFPKEEAFRVGSLLIVSFIVTDGLKKILLWSSKKKEKR